MELKEGLEFYQRCLESAKITMTELMNDDQLLDRMIEIQKTIEVIEELLR